MQRPALFATAVLLSAVLAAAKPAQTAQPATALEPGTARWAHVEIKGPYPEKNRLPGLFGDVTESLADSIDRLERAAKDDEVTGLLLRIRNPQIGWGKLHELRQAVKRVRETGKPVYAWLDAATSKDYLLATACDRVVMPESGMLMLLGLRAEVSFYKNLFDKLAIEADVLRVGEFKSAAEPFTRTGMSPQFRQEMEALLDDYYRQMTEMIAGARGLEQSAVEMAIDSGPHTAAAAEKLGLIDRIAYEDELIEIVRSAQRRENVEFARGYGKKKRDTDFSGFAGMVKMMNLMMGVQPSKRRSNKPQIAVIHATGAITTGSSEQGMFGDTLGSKTLVKAIRKAADDDQVKAIVLRVDSPGGSALASDLIWRALQEVDKPVVASMGDTAASGGYYISMGADTIFAEPGTLTGSIGVVGGKLAFSGFLNKIGITTSVVSRGRNSGVGSVLNGFSESERKAVMKLLNSFYEQFTRKAAASRGMKYEKLEKLARGRVYTGAMARESNLVDKLGTLDEAVAHAKQLAGLKPDQEIERKVLPRPVSPFEQLFGPVDADARADFAGSPGVLRELGKFAPDLTEKLKTLSIVQQLARETRLTLMPFQVTVE